MALNKTLNKIEALVLNKTGTTPIEKFKLGEETKNAILALVSEYNYLSDFGSNVKIGSVSAPGQGSILVFKQPNIYLKEKTDLGVGALDKASLDTVAIGWGKPRYKNTAFSKYDQDRGLNQAAASFIAKAVEEGAQSRQLLGFKDLLTGDTKKASNTLSAAVLSDAKQFRDRILTEASQFLSVVNDTEGIKGIKMEDVIIHISALEAFKLIEIIGDQAMKQFENGLYQSMKLGGFTIRVNDLLPRVDGKPKVVIGTNFTYKSFHGIVGAKTEVLNGSFDLVAYYEDAIAQGFVYSGLVKVLY